MTPRHLHHVVGALALAAALGVAAAACGDSTSTPAANSSTVAATTAHTASVAVSKAWARTSPSGATTGAAYFSIVSPVDDRLLSVKVDASIAMSAELHATMQDSGGMTMSPVDGVDLKAGVPFTLQPGAHHIMLMGLVKPLKAGDSFTLSITLQKAGTISVAVPVQDNAP